MITSIEAQPITIYVKVHNCAAPSEIPLINQETGEVFGTLIIQACAENSQPQNSVTVTEIQDPTRDVPRGVELPENDQLDLKRRRSS